MAAAAAFDGVILEGSVFILASGFSWEKLGKKFLDSVPPFPFKHKKPVEIANKFLLTRTPEDALKAFKILKWLFGFGPFTQ